MKKFLIPAFAAILLSCSNETKDAKSSEETKKEPQQLKTLLMPTRSKTDHLIIGTAVIRRMLLWYLIL
jgi:hypothetical protein